MVRCIRSCFIFFYEIDCQYYKIFGKGFVGSLRKSREKGPPGRTPLTSGHRSWSFEKLVLIIIIFFSLSGFRRGYYWFALNCDRGYASRFVESV